MAVYTRLIREVSFEKFTQMLATLARQSREDCFRRHRIRRPPQGRQITRIGSNNAIRFQRLFEVLQHQEDEALAEEMLHSWFLTQRPLLEAALDYLKIPHLNGLTDSQEIKRMEGLSKDELQQMALELLQTAPLEDVELYLKFMGAQQVDEALETLKSEALETNLKTQ